MNRRSRSRRVSVRHRRSKFFVRRFSSRRLCHDWLRRRKFWRKFFHKLINRLSRHEFFHDGFFRCSRRRRQGGAQFAALLFKLGNSKFLASFLGGGCGVAVPLGLQLRFQVNFALAPLAFNDDPRGGRRSGRGGFWRGGRGGFS